MAISLRIDNVDSLPDGGPIVYRAEGRGFEIGREHRDWTLPDPNMFISGRHCEVRFENGGYWLYDVSRNGTFLNGGSQRMKSPHPLASGDRLKIGHYLISVSVDDTPEVAEAPSFSAPASDNIWDVGGPAPAPISRRDLMPPPRRGSRGADFAERHFELPPVIGGDFGNEGRARVQPDAFAQNPQGESPFGEGLSQARRPITPAEAPTPSARPSALDPVPEPFGAFPDPQAAARPQPVRSPPPPGAVPASTPAGAGAEAILRAIASGAGVSPNIFLQRDAADVAAEIGAVLRAVVEELAILLKARAAAKLMAKSGSRTMISAVDNNPLKFVPRAEEVLEIMFARRTGYLDARHSIDGAFNDLKTHEFATYAAMQKALARLVEELSPETIERKVESSAFSSRKARAWETFVATWEALEKPHENGMLDVFLAYFSDAYAKASKPK